MTYARAHGADKGAVTKRSFITLHSAAVMAVVASVAMMGISPANAAIPSAVGTATTVPAAPAIMPATSGTAEAVAVWTAPIADGGSPIIRYHVRMVDAATGTKDIASKDVAAPATSLSFTGLPGGVPVRFQVQAVNAVGAGPLSSLSNAVIPATRPGAPRIGTSTAGVGSAMGRWTAPASSGSAITKYHVRMVDGATGTKALAVRDIAGNLTSLNFTGLRQGTSVRFEVQAINALGASGYSTRSNPVTVLGPPGYHTGTQTIGYSLQRRAITLTIVGSPTAKKRVMVIGQIHGNERAGAQIARTLAKSRAPAGVAYFVVSYPNPDGAALNTRGNARRVDLNRNFPGWKRNGRPGYVYYPGTGALSEPESKAIYAAINKIKPTAFVTYHQHMNVVDYGGGNKAAQVAYARQTGMRFTQLSRYPGSQATWLHAAYPRSTVMTVELPSRATGTVVSRHLAALKYLAAHH